MINFWASWCIPCRTEVALLEQAFRAGHGKVQFLGIVQRHIKCRPLPSCPGGSDYPVGSDNSGDTAIRYGLPGVPTTIFVSSSGRIAGRIIGQLQADFLRSALKEAFRSSTTPTTTRVGQVGLPLPGSDRHAPVGFCCTGRRESTRSSDHAGIEHTGVAKRRRVRCLHALRSRISCCVGNGRTGSRGDHRQSSGAVLLWRRGSRA